MLLAIKATVMSKQQVSTAWFQSFYRMTAMDSVTSYQHVVGEEDLDQFLALQVYAYAEVFH